MTHLSSCAQRDANKKAKPENSGFTLILIDDDLRICLGAVHFAAVEFSVENPGDRFVNHEGNRAVKRRFNQVERNDDRDDHRGHCRSRGPHKNRGHHEVPGAHHSGHREGSGDQCRDCTALCVVLHVNQSGDNDVAARRKEMHHNADDPAGSRDRQPLNDAGHGGDDQTGARPEQEGADENRNVRRIVFLKRGGRHDREMDQINQQNRHRDQYREMCQKMRFALCFHVNAASLGVCPGVFRA